MTRLGFVVMEPPRHGFLWEFTHPDTGARRYAMSLSESYTHALERFEAELRAIQVRTMFQESALRSSWALSPRPPPRAR